MLSSAPPPSPRPRRLFAVPPLGPGPSVPCDHLQDTTTRYDHAEKLLSFLLVCPVCQTERLIDSLRYEPSFEPDGAPEPGGATVHQLQPRRHEQPTRRAA